MITNLDTLDKDVLIKLYERAKHIKNLLELHNEVLQKMEPLSAIIDPYQIYITINSYISVLYRSLFQASEWMLGMRFEGIDPRALLGTAFSTWEVQHNNQIEYVNKVLVHQDATTDKRGIYPEQITGEKDVVWHASPNSLDSDMGEMMNIIMLNLNSVFRNQNGRDINLMS